MQASWHEKYRNSAWVYIGGLSFELSEGDILAFMSQWGEIEDINLVRDRGTNKSLGFCFLKYEDQRSTILAVDNFNGIKLLGRTLRCDHVDKYKLPKDIRENEEKALEEDPSKAVVIGPGHAYLEKELENEFSIDMGVNPWVKPSRENDRKRSKENKYHRKEHEHSRSSKKESKKKEHKREHKKEHKRERAIEKKGSISDDDVYLSQEFSDSNSLSKPPIVSSLSLSGGIGAFGDNSQSSNWRGRLDPTAASVVNTSLYGGHKRDRQNDSSAAGMPPPKRDTLTVGYGGMGRRR